MNLNPNPVLVQDLRDDNIEQDVDAPVKFYWIIFSTVIFSPG